MAREEALSHLLVIEYAEGFAAPLCGRMLAELGAAVIKVEEPTHPDAVRFHGPFRHGRVDPNASGLFLHLNANKLSLAIDLSVEEGRAAMRGLLARADVFIESWPPGLVSGLGLGWEAVSLLNPQLVMTSITPYGQDGPDSSQPATELTVWHAGGLGFIWRERDTEGNPGLPVIGACNQASFQAGVNAAGATMAALFARGRTGRGQHVDISTQEVLASIAVGAFPILAVEGRVMGRDRQVSWIVPTGAKRCKDGDVILSGREEEHWQRLVEAMGRPAWAFEDWCLDRNTRAQNADLVDAMMEEWRMSHTKDEIVTLCQAHRVPCSKVCTPAEVLADPHLGARSLFVTVDTGVGEPMIHIAAPYRLSATPPAVKAPAPPLGRDSRRVLREVLRYDDRTVDALARKGVIL